MTVNFELAQDFSRIFFRSFLCVFFLRFVIAIIKYLVIVLEINFYVIYVNELRRRYDLN